MERHYGQIVELTVRKKGYNITELARLAAVDRRTVYNWFNQKYLKTEIIYRIGTILKHDFSVEFPTLLTGEDFHDSTTEQPIGTLDSTLSEGRESLTWKNRYISLLEEYNSLLRKYINVNEKHIGERKFTIKEN
jgi:lambda repressor-like predicted transcriptional regulator